MDHKATEESIHLEEKEKTSIFQNSIIVAVSFSGVFTVVTTFFTSIIISKYDSYDPSVNIPTLLLILSTFGFLYATLVYSNITGMIYRGYKTKAKHSAILGNVLSEYFGVYFLILAIPLIINVISSDLFLRLSAATIDMFGLFIYHISGMSIMGRNYPKLHNAFLGVIFLFEVALIYFQFSHNIAFEVTASLLIAFMAIVAYYARKEVI